MVACSRRPQRAAARVPNLKLGGGAVLARHHLRENCGARPERARRGDAALHEQNAQAAPTVTLLSASKLPRTKRMTMQLLPTPESPSSTSLTRRCRASLASGGGGSCAPAGRGAARLPAQPMRTLNGQRRRAVQGQRQGRGVRLRDEPLRLPPLSHAQTQRALLRRLCGRSRRQRCCCCAPQRRCRAWGAPMPPPRPRKSSLHGIRAASHTGAYRARALHVRVR